MPTTPAEVFRRRVEAVERLREATLRHEARGDAISADIFRELHAEALVRLHETVRPGAHELAPGVGDHPAERRL